MATIADDFCKAVTEYIAIRMGNPTGFIGDMPWQERERLFDAREIQVCWICGLPYTWKADRPESPIELLVAPVMHSARYGGCPVYFSDVVVHTDSPFQCFADLRGRSWACNEARSHSGYNLVRFQLASIGETSSFFGNVMMSGAHQSSLHMILNGQVDASAINSTVLEAELQHHPEYRAHLHVIEVLGPSPSPPWLIQKSVPRALKEALRGLLLQMHEDPLGREILARARVASFTHVADQDYDLIRHMDQVAHTVPL